MGRQTQNNDSGKDVFMDRDELPPRFRRMILSPAEIEAIDVSFLTYLTGQLY